MTLDKSKSSSRQQRKEEENLQKIIPGPNDIQIPVQGILLL
jgi:hypothetical protein